MEAMTDQSAAKGLYKCSVWVNISMIACCSNIAHFVRGF